MLGITFKENCPDIRNSRVYDPWADKVEVKHEYNLDTSKYEAMVLNRR